MNLLSLARAIKIEELMSNCEFGLWEILTIVG